MSYKVSFFLCVAGGLLMLASVICHVLGDKTPTGTVLWLIGVAAVLVSMLPKKNERV